MAHYLVRAKPREERMGDLKEWLESGDIGQMSPFGPTLEHSLRNARLDSSTGQAVWEEEDYCRPPLRMERDAVLDEYFTDITVEAVEEDAGWARIEDLPSLWSALD